jgi:hypothetical protein
MHSRKWIVSLVIAANVVLFIACNADRRMFADGGRILADGGRMLADAASDDAQAQVGGSTCGRWEVRDFEHGDGGLDTDTSTTLEAGWEPFGIDTYGSFRIFARRCVE